MRGILKDVLVYAEYWVAWTNSVCPCLLVTHYGMKVTEDVAGHCPPLAGGRGGNGTSKNPGILTT